MEEKHTRGPWEPVTDRQYSDLPYIVIGAGASDAKSVEWHAHGCCRGFDDEAPLPTSEAVELAKRTIAKALGHDA